MRETGQVLFECSIEVDSHKIKKNSRPIFFNKKTGRSFIGKDKSLHDAESQLVRKIRDAWFRWQVYHPNVTTITGPVSIEFLFHFPRSVYLTAKGIKSRRLPDLSNLYQLPEDCLQKALVIENDWQVESHDGSRRLCSDSFRLEISIRGFTDGQEKEVVV